MSAKKSFYEYKSQDGRKYYYDPISKVNTYEKPLDAYIFDPQTQNLIYRPPKQSKKQTVNITNDDENKAGKNENSRHRHHHRTRVNDDQAIQKDNSKQIEPSIRHRSSTIAIKTPERLKNDAQSKIDLRQMLEKSSEQNSSEEIPRKHQPMNMKSHSKTSMDLTSMAKSNPQIAPPQPSSHETSSHNSQSPPPTLSDNRTEIICGKLESDFAKQALENPFPIFAQENFKPRKATLFSKQVTTAAKLSEFSPEPLKDVLLSKTDNPKLACSCFDHILSYIGVNKCKTPDLYANKLIKICLENNSLVDEVYIQVLKEINKCPELSISKKAWDLLLIISTIIPPSSSIIPVLLSFISATVASHPSSQFERISQLVYIRLEARYNDGKIMKNRADPLSLHEIPNQINPSYNPQFGFSLNEIMWRQKESFPRLPFPYIVYAMIEEIKKKNGYHITGLFRLPGNMKLVGDLSTEIGVTKDIEESLQNLTLHDVGSLLKQWFRDLENPVVPFDIAEELEKTRDHQKRLEIAQKLPRKNKYTLMFLVGFLQEAKTHANETKMEDNNLAIVFGPNIVQLQDKRSSDQNAMRIYTSLGNEFLLDLIHMWDTSEIYPLDPRFLEKD